MQPGGAGREDNIMSDSSSPGFSGGPYHSERRLIKTKRAQLVSLYMRGGFFFFFGGGGKQKYFTTLFVFFFLEASLAVVKHGRDSCG